MSINIETVATPQKTARGPAEPADASAVYLGTKNRMPEFVLTDKVVCVSGAGRGLGLVQAEALLEAGAIVYALDRLPEPVRLFYHYSTETVGKLMKVTTERRLRPHPSQSQHARHKNRIPPHRRPRHRTPQHRH